MRTVYALVSTAAVLLSSGLSFGAEQLGTAEQARAMLDRAFAALKADKAAALKAFNDEHNKEFHDRDLFVYCFNVGDGKFTAYNIGALLGADIRSFKLYNEPMGQRAYDAVHDAPAGDVATIEYRYPKPGAKTPSAKEALEGRLDDQACGVSYFK